MADRGWLKTALNKTGSPHRTRLVEPERSGSVPKPENARVDVRLIAASTIAALVVSAAMAADDASLLAEARQVFQPLPKDMSTADAPVTKERVMLGRMLFFDPRLTADVDRGETATASSQCPHDSQRRTRLRDSLARRP